MLTKNEQRTEQAKLMELRKKFEEATKLTTAELDNIFQLNSKEVQHKLAPLFRKIVIDHLANSEGVVAQGFRGNYSAVSVNYKEFLKTQAKDKEWGTYIEASALGEKFNCNVVVTYKRPGKEDSTWCLYRASGDAPTIHVNNNGNIHWYLNNETDGNGNCLHNTFAQAFQKFLATPKKKSETIPLTQQGVFKPIVMIDDAIRNQERVIRAIEAHPTPNELKEQLENQREAEDKRLSQLPPEQRDAIEKQIRSDHELALRLAREEVVNPSYGPRSKL